jgi:hypothetical protein
MLLRVIAHAQRFKSSAADRVPLIGTDDEM